MIRAIVSKGEGPYGLSLMKFTLTYEGELRSNDDYRRKWEIRKHFHPQLQELWRISPALRSIQKTRFLPKSAYNLGEIHHSIDNDDVVPPVLFGDKIDLLEPLKIGAREFLPLVRNSLALQCGLRIIFLRKENPGRIYQGGDLDNRLKTLFDALSMPNSDQIPSDPAIDNPIYCVIENDSMIQKIDVDTQRLLSRPGSTQHEVNLIIEVDVRVTDTRLYNHIFLGD